MAGPAACHLAAKAANPPSTDLAAVGTVMGGSPKAVRTSAAAAATPAASAIVPLMNERLETRSTPSHRRDGDRDRAASGGAERERRGIQRRGHDGRAVDLHRVAVRVVTCDRHEDHRGGVDR